MSSTRIGFSGTNWVGKSTTIRLFTKQLLATEYRIFSLSKVCETCPHPLMKLQSIDASKYVAGSLFNAINDCGAPEKINIFDRTAIDIIAFTLYAEARDAIRDDSNLLAQLAQSAKTFDVIFFLDLEPKS